MSPGEERDLITDVNRIATALEKIAKVLYDMERGMPG